MRVTRRLAALAGLLAILALAIPGAAQVQLTPGVRATFDGTLTVDKAIIVAGGTALTKLVVYSQSLTPAASSAAIQTAEQTFTVTGIATTDVLYLNGPVPTSLCPPVTIRASATNQIAIGFTTLTAVACTPAAGTYKIVAIRS